MWELLPALTSRTLSTEKQKFNEKVDHLFLLPVAFKSSQILYHIIYVGKHVRHVSLVNLEFQSMFCL